MNWITYFEDFFVQRAEKISSILDAGGFRERWVQGELFLAGQDLGIKTEATSSKFDILCDSPSMIAEIKLCGGNYSDHRKRRSEIEDDAHKLSRAPGDYERFMILIVDTRYPDTELGQWLMTCDFPHIKKHERTVSASVTIRLWQIEEAVTSQT